MTGEENMDTNKNLNNSLCSFDDFQEKVSEVLSRHKSILDIMTKLDEYNSRINRAVAKSVTNCGCIEINAKKQSFDSDSIEDMKKHAKSHLEGHICPNCKDILEDEIGAYMFYLAALSNNFDIQIADVLEKENNRNKLLGLFGLK